MSSADEAESESVKCPPMRRKAGWYRENTESRPCNAIIMYCVVRTGFFYPAPKTKIVHSITTRQGESRGTSSYRDGMQGQHASVCCRGIVHQQGAERTRLQHRLRGDLARYSRNRCLERRRNETARGSQFARLSERKSRSVVGTKYVFVHRARPGHLGACQHAHHP